jgi:hypothetical protein
MDVVVLLLLLSSSQPNRQEGIGDVAMGGQTEENLGSSNDGKGKFQRGGDTKQASIDDIMFELGRNFDQG